MNTVPNYAPQVLSDGSDNHQRNLSECGTYAIQRFTFYRADGTTCGLGDECAPYWVGFRRSCGTRLTGNCASLAYCAEVIANG